MREWHPWLAQPGRGTVGSLKERLFAPRSASPGRCHVAGPGKPHAPGIAAGAWWFAVSVAGQLAMRAGSLIAQARQPPDGSAKPARPSSIARWTATSGSASATRGMSDRRARGPGLRPGSCASGIPWAPRWGYQVALASRLLDAEGRVEGRQLPMTSRPATAAGAVDRPDQGPRVLALPSVPLEERV